MELTALLLSRLLYGAPFLASTGLFLMSFFGIAIGPMAIDHSALLPAMVGGGVTQHADLPADRYARSAPGHLTYTGWC
jgi:hypothetical protein